MTDLSSHSPTAFICFAVVKTFIVLHTLYQCALWVKYFKSGLQVLDLERLAKMSFRGSEKSSYLYF